LKSTTLANLRRVCGYYGIVPTSYVLAGVVRNEPVPHKAGIFAETWRGIYKTKPVSIKIFKIIEGHKDYDKVKVVRQIVLAQRTQSFRSSNPLSFVSFTEILQGSGPLETTRAQKHPPILRRLGGRRRVLFDLSVDEEWHHHGARPQQPPSQSTRVGTCDF